MKSSNASARLCWRIDCLFRKNQKNHLTNENLCIIIYCIKALKILSNNRMSFQRAVVWCETADIVVAVSYRS